MEWFKQHQWMKPVVAVRTRAAIRAIFAGKGSKVDADIFFMKLQDFCADRTTTMVTSGSDAALNMAMMEGRRSVLLLIKNAIYRGGRDNEQDVHDRISSAARVLGAEER